MATESGSEMVPSNKSHSKAAVLSFYAFIRILVTRVQEGDQVGLYKHLRTMNMGEKRYAARGTRKTRTAHS